MGIYRAVSGQYSKREHSPNWIKITCKKFISLHICKYMQYISERVPNRTNVQQKKKKPVKGLANERPSEQTNERGNM